MVVIIYWKQYRLANFEEHEIFYIYRNILKH